MPNAHNICCDCKRLRPLVEFAVREGWKVSRAAGGHLTFEKSGMPPIFTSFTASDHRTSQNAWARLRHFARNAAGGRHD